MSPNVGNFVHDLVEMAKAMETLPQVQAELDRSHTQVEEYAKQVQDREISIISYKQIIEDLTTKVRSLEVERDDASFRVLEAEELSHKALSFARQSEVAAAAVISLLNPPKPEPIKELEPIPAVAPWGRDIPAWDGPDASTSQGNANPTPNGSTQANTDAPVVGNQETASPTPPDASMVKPLGAYHNLRYVDHPSYVSREDWKSGGGSEYDYDYRYPPQRSVF